MKVLSKTIESAQTIKKSKFICFGYFVQTKDQVKDIINDIKKKYPDASHVCYAYILDDKTYYFTDGGEPSGSAGKPIYGALQSYKLNYTLFIVVRYFGGIKFGPGPLRQTFKNVTLSTLKLAQTQDARISDVVKIQIPLSLTKQIDSLFKNSILDKKYSHDDVIITIKGDFDKISLILNKLNIKPISVELKQIVK
ncbi:MAG: YigZ family protein [Mycoplasmoidaceae bacterium]|nr:YigZ family protein [Mycoplasmoidaceae bacterium]